ncbi:MAG: hypothetical protein LM517_02705 [Nitrosomonas sp.]|nr:hypothetical protein [Nitrosomonas sp.]
MLPITIGCAVVYLASFTVENLNSINIQPIVSTVATVSGILFGFVMASVTLLVSAKENTLVQNTKKTGYLPKLIKRLHNLMFLLLAACIVFIICLFLPDSAVISGNSFFSTEIRYLILMLQLGIFIFSVSVINFVFVWREFSNFASHM